MNHFKRIEALLTRAVKDKIWSAVEASLTELDGITNPPFIPVIVHILAESSDLSCAEPTSLNVAAFRQAQALLEKWLALGVLYGADRLTGERLCNWLKSSSNMKWW